MIVETEAPNN